jgi:hypothetical protein
MNSWWDFGESSGQKGTQLDIGLIKCAFCSVEGQMKRIDSFIRKSESSNKVLNYETIKCENCGNFMFVFWSASTAGWSLYNYSTLPYPLGEIEAPEHWHKDVKRFWLQAHKSLKAENWDAAAIMARSALQIVMREQGANGRNLYAEINDLHSKGILPPIMKDFADEVRALGNDSAHPAIGMQVTRKDSEDIVEFLDILLDYIYNLPKKINDYRARKNTP